MKYNINVTTSDKRGAGTDARVSVELFGLNGCLGPCVLDNSPENFQRGQVPLIYVKKPKPNFVPNMLCALRDLKDC